MQNNFEYNLQKVFMNSVDVAEIGDTALRCENSKGFEYYVYTSTYLGKTSILKFGPKIPGCPVLPEAFDLSFKRIDYKEATIIREIDKFINDGRHFIINITEVLPADVLAELPDATSFSPEI